MNTINKFGLFFIFVVLLTIIFPACSKYGSQKSNDYAIFSSYRDIPGVTAEEIAAVEALRAKVEYFNFGMLPNIETFIDVNGEIRGYSALLCEWLSKLFGIPFIPKHYSWMPLLEGLENGEVDFTGDLTANDERRKVYTMTDAIAQRSIKYFRLNTAASFSEIRQTRQPRYILQEKTTITEDVLHYAGDRFEPVYITEYDEVYELLITG
ncbi:MAG: transporter substrate-binding domain-containing protein, partial [Treponema sp.]|nr:transporter substrate-binding domain-containing protein [Treponema sp.]